mmetsp:Transcript_11211/g.41976  ORF Transcript_11211/g.41976 Transcript_11211/m.41976 type:complete len:234 (+) Transcript_11211:1024-1725(+)
MACHVVQLWLSDGHCEIFYLSSVGVNVWQVDFVLGYVRQVDFGLLGSLTDSLESEGVLAQVNALLSLKFVQNVLNQNIIEILSSQEGVSVGGSHLENSVLDLQNGNIKSTTTQIVYSHNAVLSIESIRKSSGSRLIDDAFYIHSCNGSSILCGFSLGIVKIGRHGDDRTLNLLAQVILSSVFHLCENHGSDFGRRVCLSSCLEICTSVWSFCNLVWSDLLFVSHVCVVEFSSN